MDEPQLTVILPAFDAGHSIVESIGVLSVGLAAAGVMYEIIVVNDGSTDDTAQQLAALSYPQTRILTHPKNLGKGAAIKQGLKLARAKYVVFTDDDLPYGTEAILRCHQELLSCAALVIGDRTLLESRVSIRIPLLRRLLSGIYSGLISLLLYKHSSSIRDTQCGVKGFWLGFGKEFLLKSKINRFAFDLEMVVFANENCIPIIGLPVGLMKNKTSSVRLFWDPLNMLCDVFRIAFNVWLGHYRSEALQKGGSHRPEGNSPLVTREIK